MWCGAVWVSSNSTASGSKRARRRRDRRRAPPRGRPRLIVGPRRVHPAHRHHRHPRGADRHQRLGRGQLPQLPADAPAPLHRRERRRRGRRRRRHPRRQRERVARRRPRALIHPRHAERHRPRRPRRRVRRRRPAPASTSVSSRLTFSRESTSLDSACKSVSSLRGHAAAPPLSPHRHRRVACRRRSRNPGPP